MKNILNILFLSILICISFTVKSQIYTETITKSFCKGYLYIDNSTGFEINTDTASSGQYLYYKNQDSLYTYDITILPTFKTIIKDTISRGSVYNRNGFYIDTKTDTTTFIKPSLQLQAINGCDSLIGLWIRYTNDTVKDIICVNKNIESSYKYRFPNLDKDTIITQEGYYKIEYKDSNDFDRIVHLYLDPKPAYYDTIKAYIYTGNKFKEFGFNVGETGIWPRDPVLLTDCGCDSVLVLDLIVVKLLFPTAVTPDGNGHNDKFKIHNLVEQAAFPKNELTIYNRYGRIIYNRKDISKEEDFWDPEKTNSPTGTYFYRFVGKGGIKELIYTGSVEVLRK